ncbi:MAG TPA: helix-turn-helix domain-containing protein [Edaphobacter sp.]|nr:helix-turn-helix domain-containing protein [Edaphobacter sp.]
MDEREISVVEAARRLRVTLHHLYSLLWEGRLQAQKVKGQWRVSADAVEARRKRREAGMQ